ncbi:rod-determining factor RdfA [Natronomonas marina]|jgi:hypothetical protein|uniref:rod-determining factor RdfA n=1 Tax=Natronomonas marina TaxID=2961939 RepID=UPI0020C97E3D|nr:rod-determining factor RdfA [Natronomonas marina]
MGEVSNEARRGRRSKVARLIDEYDLNGIGAEMERRWTAEEDRWSLRELAAHFNQSVLEAALETEGAQLLDGEVENTYRLLTDEDVGSADRTRARRRLEREGVDIDAVLDDFVTYQAIRTYLKKHRDAEYEADETDPLEREISNIQQLRGRVDSVTEGKLEQFRDGGHLTLGEFRTFVDVRVVCEDCNTQYDVVELLEAGGCECAE